MSEGLSVVVGIKQPEVANNFRFETNTFLINRKKIAWHLQLISY